MLSTSLGLDSPIQPEEPKEQTALDISTPTTPSANAPAATPVVVATDNNQLATERKVHHLTPKETYYIKQQIAQDRLKRYAQDHLKSDFFAVGKVQRAVINIQRMMRGKLARRQYQSLQDSKYALIELLLFIMYLLFHIWFSFLRKDNVDMFYLSKMMEDGIVHEEFPGPTSGGNTYIKKTFLDVATVEEFWDYLEGPFRANVFPEKCRDANYNGIPCLGAMNTVNHLVGTVRLRQFRVNEMKSCPMPNLLHGIPHVVNTKCYDSWQTKYASDSNYSISDITHPNNDVSNWNPTQNDSYVALSSSTRKELQDCFVHHDDRRSTGFFDNSFVTGGWLYSDASSVGGTSWDPYPAKQGFRCDFDPTIDPMNKFQALKEFHWIDQQTRAVLVELSVYNKPTNLFSSMRLILEFPRTGGIQVYYEPYTGYLFSSLNPSSFNQEIIALAMIDLMTLGFMFQEFGELKSLGACNYFSSLWNTLDWLNYAFLAGVTYWYIGAVTDAQITLGDHQMSQTGEFTDVFNLVYKYRWIDYTFSVDMIFVFLKMLKYVRLSPKLSIVSETLTSTIASSAGFFVIFILLLLAYALAFWFTYGQMIFEFRTLSNSFMTCLYGLIAGEFAVFFNEAYYANRTLGPMLSITFIIIMNLLSFSIVIAMVEDAYEIAKARGKTKKGLDPLLVQLILGLRSVRTFLEKLPCCPCIRKTYSEVKKNGVSSKRGLKRECTVLDMIKGTKQVKHMTLWQLISREILHPYAPTVRLHERTNLKHVYKDILQQEENLRKARMLLIEKTVLEMSMRLSNTKDEDEVITLEDVTQVHFANMQKERTEVKNMVRRASLNLRKRELAAKGKINESKNNENASDETDQHVHVAPSLLSHFNITTDHGNGDTSTTTSNYTVSS